MNEKILIPSEDEEQATLFEWADINTVKYPCLKNLYAIPNGGKRPKSVAKTMKRTGTKRGVPDICLPVPKGKYHGLYIELKRIKDGRLSTEQRQWLRDLDENGYKAVMCKGWQEAVHVLVNYITERGDKP